MGKQSNMNTPCTFHTLLVATLVLLISACGSAPTQTNTTTLPQAPLDKPEPVPATTITGNLTYVDSTVLFAEDTASASMRATFTPDGTKMLEGYKFQFRSIKTDVVFLSSISIIAGGERIFLEEGQIALPKERGITLSLSLEDSLAIANYKTALLQFRYDNESFLMEIALHKLAEFLPQ